MSRKKTSKTFRDYHSSDYGNEEDDEDYGPDYEDDDDMGNRPGRPSKRQTNHPDFEDSDSASRDDGGKRRRQRYEESEGDHIDGDDDTYEDEDPFSPEVDIILADKQVEVSAPPQTSGTLI
jgi:hypothetical protein